MLKIGENWGRIANYPPPPNAQQRSAPLTIAINISLQFAQQRQYVF